MSMEPLVIDESGDMLRGKTLIVGFPGMAFVGKMTAEYLIEKLMLKRVLTIYPSEAPAAVAVTNGLLEPPSINIYASENHSIGVLTGPFQPKNDESQQRLAHRILEILRKKEVREIIAAAAFVVAKAGEERRVYATATDNELLGKLLDMGCVPMEGGISGLNGLIPALARMYGMRGAVLLGETGEIYVAGGMTDYKSVASVVKIVSEYIGEKIDTTDLYRKAEQLEETIRKAFTITKEKPPKEEEPSTHM